MLRAGQLTKRILQPGKHLGGMESTYAAPSPIYVDVQTSRSVLPAQSPPPSECRDVSMPTWTPFFPFTPTKEVSDLLLQPLEGDRPSHGDIVGVPTSNTPSATMRHLYDRLHCNQGNSDGALRPGGAISLWDRSHCGLVLGSLFVGFMLGALPSTILSSDVRVATVAPLLGPLFSPIFGVWSPVMLFPASIRFFFGVLSDLCPLYSSHRKPYMLIGWSVAFLSFLLAAILLSTSALHEASLVLMLVASLGVTLTDVAGDGLMVELAQREPLHSRGKTQSIVMASKGIGLALSQVYVGVLEGSVSTQWTPHDPTYLGFLYSLAMLSAVSTLFVWYLYTPPPPPPPLPSSSPPPSSVLDRILALWTCLQSKAILSFLLFSFVSSFAVHVGSGGTSQFKRRVLDVYVEQTWLRTGGTTIPHPHDHRLVLVVVVLGAVVFAIAMAIFGITSCGGSTKPTWKLAMTSTTLAIGVLGTLHASYTVYGTCRAPWFWYGVLVLVQIPHGIRHLVSMLPVVELAPMGYEATMASLAMSMQLMAIPVATAAFSSVQRAVLERFDAQPTTVTNVEMQIGDLICLSPLAGFGVLLSLVWLPGSKIEAQVWRRGGGRSRVLGWTAVVVGGGGGLTLLLVISTLLMYSTWSCAAVLGGRGCSPRV
ncbi:hypothetical protein DYB31_013487 [Aphanomyces astaci]|uniref:Major facilitator superfamily (MFS) profile domain-containing protein n=1 Tax=Aphanomyces astaci TaxID=112090 RepID=A0A397EWE4_APHAT|nr:hypothetical protein DYB31_013487 [Aphanomyces astaci]